MENAVEISFTHVNDGLKFEGTELKGFTISNGENNFIPAKAYIKKKKIIVYNDSIKNPVAVRYGWANTPNGNLYNSNGLPASPFRTDIVYNTYWNEIIKE
ncbi:hypothetical protein [Thalassobellus suaedae]|uniref:Uncharacterized protein n=1 Tax=Thalassobellus suaedae TaxID=3074124 RepID=A0ABY9XUP6_9FLAO|nr:hypothetical protein RHP51_02810 [Flavobacteriaceae bacterium HL-DH14]